MVDFLAMLYNPERLFKYRQAHNPCYPFTEIRRRVFVLRDADTWYIYELVCVLAVAAAYVAVVVTSGWFLQLLLIPPIFLVIVLPVILSGRKNRVLIFDGNVLIYEYYVDDELVYHGHCHNLYIRVKYETGGSEESHYYSLVVNGYGMREYSVTAVSDKREKLYLMGRRLAAHLNLNFFDSADRSANHVVRHYCPVLKEEVSSSHEEHKSV